MSTLGGFLNTQWWGYAGPVVEILILWGILYLVLRFLEGSTGEGVLRGFFAAMLVGGALVLLASRLAALERLSFVLEKLLALTFIAVVIIFQPEIRRGLIRIGESPFLSFLSRGGNPVIDAIVQAVSTMAQKKIGSLLALERTVGLKGYAERGIPIDAAVSAELLVSIFFPDNPLHDGGVIIRNGRIAAAGCLFPLSDQPNLGKSVGTRHRAAVGLTEESDAVCIVVSEETAKVSVAVGGELMRELSAQELERILVDLYLLSEEVSFREGTREV